MSARILAIVLLALCGAMFFAWRATRSPEPVDVQAPSDEIVAPPARPAEPLTPSTRARVPSTPVKPVDVEPAEVVSGCTVRGRVLDQSGRPVAQRDVWLMKADRRTPVCFSFLPERADARGAKSDDDGRFTFKGTASGTWWIGPCASDAAKEPPQDRIAAFGQVLVIEEAAHEIEVEIRAGRGLYLRGTLIDRRGGHAQRGLVRARDLDSGLLSYTSINKAGLFDLGPLRPGRYEICGWSREADASSEPMRVTAGDDGIELKMRPGAMMTGTIVDENGTNVFASLRIASREEQSFPSPVAESLRDGTFRVPGLDPGNYDIVATTLTGRVGFLGPIRLGVGESMPDLAVPIAPGGKVRVRFDGPEPVGMATLIQAGRTIATVELQRGIEHEFGALRGPGVVRLELLETGRVIEREVEVSVGKTADAVFAAEDQR